MWKGKSRNAFNVDTEEGMMVMEKKVLVILPWLIGEREGDMRRDAGPEITGLPLKNGILSIEI